MSSVSFGLAFFLLLHPDFFYVIVIVWCSSLDALSVPVAAWDTGDQQFYICFVYDDHRRDQDARIDDKRLKHSYLLKKGEEKSIQALDGHMKCNVRTLTPPTVRAPKHRSQTHTQRSDTRQQVLESCSATSA